MQNFFASVLGFFGRTLILLGLNLLIFVGIIMNADRIEEHLLNLDWPQIITEDTFSSQIHDQSESQNKTPLPSTVQAKIYSPELATELGKTIAQTSGNVIRYLKGQTDEPPTIIDLTAIKKTIVNNTLNTNPELPPAILTEYANALDTKIPNQLSLEQPFSQELTPQNGLTLELIFNKVRQFLTSYYLFIIFGAILILFQYKLTSSNPENVIPNNIRRFRNSFFWSSIIYILALISISKVTTVDIGGTILINASKSLIVIPALISNLTITAALAVIYHRIRQTTTQVTHHGL